LKNSEKEPSDINDLIQIINNPQHETDIELLGTYPDQSNSNEPKDKDDTDLQTPPLNLKNLLL
jgi:hypothetical protein